MRNRTLSVLLNIRSVSFLLLAGAFALAGCGGESMTGPTTGTVEVAASTTGNGTDPDGYSVTLDGGNEQSLGVNGSATFSSVDAGEATLELSGVAANCSVQGQNPRTVQVQGGQTTSVTFDVACTARTGDMEVSASTTGQDQDPDGYTVTVDQGTADEASQSVGPNGTVTFAGLAEGDHEVVLSGVANNCSVDGQNPRTVTVPFDGTASVAFEVNCSDAVGDLEVSASTSGVDQDADGYTVTVDGTQSQPLGPNGTATFTGLATGTHSVELTGVASNCSVGGNNPRDVDVPNGGTASTSFDVSCSDIPGDLEVTTATTGEDPDPEYTVTVDPGTGTEQSQTVGSNGTVTFTGLSSEDHQVELDPASVAGNCTVDSTNPQTATVPEGGPASVSFDVSCVNRTGDLQAGASTTGPGTPDPDGYTVAVDPGTADETIQSIGVDGTATFSGLDEGDHVVELSDLASNCWVNGDNPRTVAVPFDATAATTFDVECFVPLSNQVVFESDRDGDRDIWVVNPDGSGLTQLTDEPGRDRTPAVSPDGTTIAFASDRVGSLNIWLMNADGSNPRQLTSSANPDLAPSWAPNGLFVVFQRVGGDSDIFTIAVDGTSEKQLTTSSADDTDPEWDRGDGNEIVFVSDRDDLDGDGTFDRDVYIMQTGGTGITPVTSDAGDDQGPSWDPSSCGTGTCQRLAFHSDRAGAPGEVFTIQRDGSGETNITNEPAADFFPSWSASGSEIVFVSRRDADGNSELWIMDPDGLNPSQLTGTASGVVNTHPYWSP